MSDGNALIHQATRLKIMASLNKLGPDLALEFTRLKAIVQTTDGNLGTHLDALEKAGYVMIEKRFEGRKPQTRIKTTAAGRLAFSAHVAYLRGIIDDGEAR
jgi:DNA-binding transcriptional ArsR family regulator